MSSPSSLAVYVVFALLTGWGFAATLIGLHNGSNPDSPIRWPFFNSCLAGILTGLVILAARLVVP